MDLFAAVTLTIYLVLLVLIVFYLLSIAGRVAKAETAAAQKSLSRHFAPQPTASQEPPEAKRQVAPPPRENPRL